MGWKIYTYNFYWKIFFFLNKTILKKKHISLYNTPPVPALTTNRLHFLSSAVAQVGHTKLQYLSALHTPRTYTRRCAARVLFVSKSRTGRYDKNAAFDGRMPYVLAARQGRSRVECRNTSGTKLSPLYICNIFFLFRFFIIVVLLLCERFAFVAGGARELFAAREIFERGKFIFIVKRCIVLEIPLTYYFYNINR